MSTLVANLGSGIACGLSLLWAALVWANIPWVFSQSMLVSFSSSLTKVTVRHGTMTQLTSIATKLVGAHKVAHQFDSMMEQALWYQEALPHFCGAGMDFIFMWCENWTVIVYGSWFTVFAGMAASLALLMGAGGVYYYANVHPTATGRTFCSACYIVAPVMGALGLASFTWATMDYGKDRNQIFVAYKEETMYGVGFIFACALVPLTCIPLYTLAVFMRRDPQEHEHKGSDSEEERRLQEGLGPQYGAAGPSAQAYPAGGAPQAQPYPPQFPQYAAGPPGGPAMMQPGAGYPNALAQQPSSP